MSQTLTKAVKIKGGSLLTTGTILNTGSISIGTNIFNLPNSQTTTLSAGTTVTSPLTIATTTTQTAMILSIGTVIGFGSSLIYFDNSCGFDDRCNKGVIIVNNVNGSGSSGGNFVTQDELVAALSTKLNIDGTNAATTMTINNLTTSGQGIISSYSITSTNLTSTGTSTLNNVNSDTENILVDLSVAGAIKITDIVDFYAGNVNFYFNNTGNTGVYNNSTATTEWNIDSSGNATFNSITSNTSTIDTLNVTTLNATNLNVIPAGMIMAYVSTTIVPVGWLVCDGTSYNTTTYPNLFAVIGTSYGGAGDQFNVPNYSAAFLRGVGSQTVNANVYTSGTLPVPQTDSLQIHQHYYQDSYFAVGDSNAYHEGIITLTGTNSVVSNGGFLFRNQTFSCDKTIKYSTPQNLTTSFYTGDNSSSVPQYDTTVFPLGTFSTETRPLNYAVVYLIKY